MVTVRLARHGAKKIPFYHVTVAEKSAKRDGRFVERIGFYNPIARGAEESLRIDLSRFDYWLANGAQPSERVRRLVARVRQTQPVAEEIEAAGVSRPVAEAAAVAADAEDAAHAEDAADAEDAAEAPAAEAAAVGEATVAAQGAAAAAEPATDAERPAAGESSTAP